MFAREDVKAFEGVLELLELHRQFPRLLINLQICQLHKKRQKFRLLTHHFREMWRHFLVLELRVLIHQGNNLTVLVTTVVHPVVPVLGIRRLRFRLLFLLLKHGPFDIRQNQFIKFPKLHRNHLLTDFCCLSELLLKFHRWIDHKIDSHSDLIKIHMKYSHVYS